MSQSSFSDYAARLEFYLESVDLDEGWVSPAAPDYEAALARVRSKRRALLLGCCGAKCFEVLRGLAAPRPVKQLLFEEVVALGVEHYDGEENPVAARFRFCSRHRGANEAWERFHAALRELARGCRFGAALEERLRDQIVLGIGDEALRDALLSDKSLSYQTAVQICSSLSVETEGLRE